VWRPWTDDLNASVARYFLGETLDGWEPQAVAGARVQSVVDEHGDVLYVTHGTVLTLYLASVVPTLDAMSFWTALTTPDAWRVDGERLVRLG
jgi:broad specificity phosphatase PhoE